jgi:hypothetical protein
MFKIPWRSYGYPRFSIDVQREWKNCVVTFWVMSQFSHLQGVVQTFVIQPLFLGSKMV